MPMRTMRGAYRAWSGLIPPRDDFLESMDPPQGRKGYSEEQIEEYGEGKRPRPDPNARAYLDFLGKIENARSAPGPSRLKALDIPSEEGKSDREKINSIRFQLDSHARQTPLRPQQPVISDREPVRLVAHVHEQLVRSRMRQ